jgi:electron transfer flavoprotein alpha subunit
VSVVCFVEKDSDGGISDPSARAVTFARSLAEQDGESVVAAVVASRTGGADGGRRSAGGGGTGTAGGSAGRAAGEGGGAGRTAGGSAGRAAGEGGGAGRHSDAEGAGGRVAAETVQTIGAYGVTDVCALVLPRALGYAPRALATGLAQLSAAARATAVVAAATDHGNEIMAHLGAMTHLPMVANCFDVERVGPTTLRLSRHRWGGSLIEDDTLESSVALLTVALDGVAPRPILVNSEPGTRTFTPDLSEDDVVVRATESWDGTSGVSLANAKVVVSGGRGLGGAEGFSAIEELAGLLKGAVGVSRAVTSLGWRPHSEQVGQTGTRVSPDLYIACGISGAIQHLAGCQSAKVMVAINTDPEAPIMARADYAVIGDVGVILPVLVQAVQRRQAGLSDA